MSLELPVKKQEGIPDGFSVPAPTAWPIVLALGVTLIFAGMVTTTLISILGAILMLSG